MDLEDKKILLTGGAGFLGKFVHKQLLSRNVRNQDIRVPRKTENDLRRRDHCRRVVQDVQVVIHLAANVGGIGYNQLYPGSLFYDNLIMGAQLMEASRRAGVEKFVQIGTICAYPEVTPVPFSETELWNGYPEPTNAPYGIAKKALLVQAQAYREQYGMNAIYLLPVNLYGPGDNFDLASSHVIPALIRKCVEARAAGKDTITAWGSGKPTREFLYVEDCARGIVMATEGYDGREPVNLGSGHEISIAQLALEVARATGYDGEIEWDSSRPDGQPRRCLDTARARKWFGFEAAVSLAEGLKRTVDWYLSEKEGL